MIHRAGVDDPQARWPSFRKPVTITTEDRSVEPEEGGNYTWRMKAKNDVVNFTHFVKARTQAEAVQKMKDFCRKYREDIVE